MRLSVLLYAVLVSVPSQATAPAWIEGNVDALARPVSTFIRYANGELQHNRGTGFVIGTRFYTAFHNIQTAPQEVVARDIVIGNMRVEPSAVDIEHDLAAFEIPFELCRSWCNDYSPNASHSAEADTVAWIRLDGESQLWKQGRVRNVAFKSILGANDAGGCEDNLVIEIDTPFVPGSSGGPVFDASSGAIVGLIQGSFETSSGQATGYYKPLECVVARLEQAGFDQHQSSDAL